MAHNNTDPFGADLNLMDDNLDLSLPYGEGNFGLNDDAFADQFLAGNLGSHDGNLGAHVAAAPFSLSVDDIQRQVKANMEQILASHREDQDRQRREVVNDVVCSLSRQHLRERTGAVPRPTMSTPQPTPFFVNGTPDPLALRPINTRGLDMLEKLVEDVSLHDFEM